MNATTFNIDDIKLEFMNSIRTYVYPQQTICASSISLYNSSNTITQTTTLFSQTISAMGVYVANTIGAPTLSYEFTSGNFVSRGTLSCTIGWNTIAIRNGATGCRTAWESQLKLTGTFSSTKDVYIGIAPLANYMFGNAGTFNTAFSIGVKDFVYRIFPMYEIENNRIPVIVLDMAGRPKIDDRYLSGDQTWYYVNLRADVYARYPSELDKISSAIDRGILRDRRNFTNIFNITPSQISEISYVKPDVYTRSVTWQLSKLIARQ